MHEYIRKLVQAMDFSKEEEYPIFLTQGEFVPMRRPYEKKIEGTLVVRHGTIHKLIYASDELFMNTISQYAKTEEAVKLAETALASSKSISSTVPFFSIMSTSCEVYRGDREVFLSEAKLIVARLHVFSAFKISRYDDKKAWAISFDWMKRITAKYPQLANLVVANPVLAKIDTGENAPVVNLGTGDYRARVIINIPLDYASLLEQILKLTNEVILPVVEDEARIRELEELIKLKEKELEELKQQLQALKMKVEIEKMKQALLAGETQ